MDHQFTMFYNTGRCHVLHRQREPDCTPLLLLLLLMSLSLLLLSFSGRDRKEYHSTLGWHSQKWNIKRKEEVVNAENDIVRCWCLSFFSICIHFANARARKKSQFFRLSSKRRRLRRRKCYIKKRFKAVPSFEKLSKICFNKNIQELT